MKHRNKILLFSLASLLFPWVMVMSGQSADSQAASAPVPIVIGSDASPLEQLAGKELRRYVYLRTGRLPELHEKNRIGKSGQWMMVSRKDRAVLKLLEGVPGFKDDRDALGREQFHIRNITIGSQQVLLVMGGDDLGVLYGVYRLAEHMGVRFYLHADVIPDERLAQFFPGINETGSPMFEVRGIQPFHDFPEGPDWWNRDDYLAYLSQLAKMRMNFLGLHCYPEGGVGPEPGVWIGLPGWMDKQGRVTNAYPSQWAATSRNGMWGYSAMKTSEFCGGADRLFDKDDFGPEIMNGIMPTPRTPEDSVKLFNDAGSLFRSVFAEARALGIKTCIGTETPLTIPKAVKEQLKAQGRDPKDLSVVKEVYQGMFQRIARMHPVDYYWLWTPEDWTWSGNKPEQLEATIKDIQAANEALHQLGDPFTLATCGWVLGPMQNRAALDNVLPKTLPMSCINREVGHDRVDPAFGKVSGRPKWAIPWMENDPGLITPQPYVGRMRYDAADAYRLGCNGLLGIHWRTKAMGPNVSALASAAWSQSWKPQTWEIAVPQRKESGARNGKPARFDTPVKDTSESIIYQSVRYDTDGYDLSIPNGVCKVILKFNEPHYEAAGKRVFGVKIQGKTVLEKLDLFARAGKNHAQDFTYEGIAVTNGHLVIDFVRQVEYPCIAGLVVECLPDNATKPLVRKINCGGFNELGNEADEWSDKPTDGIRKRTMPVRDFYVDYAAVNFGNECALEAGALLEKLDGYSLPQTSTWLDGPGGISVRAWDEKTFAFVQEMEALRSKVKGGGNLERYDYWLNTYRAHRSQARVADLRHKLDGVMGKLNKQTNAPPQPALVSEALDIRLKLAREWETMVSLQVSATDTPGELGTLANMEQHNRKKLKFINKHDESLTRALGKPLPAEAEPSHQYRGPARIIVPTVRTKAFKGEKLNLRVMAMDADSVQSVTLHWREMGRGRFKTVNATLAGRAVYNVPLALKSDDVEYYLSAQTASGRTLLWPATAPETGQTVIVTDGPKK